MFGVIDYIVFVTLLLVSVGIGLFHGVKGMLKSKDTKESADEFTHGGKSMSSVPVALSLLASFMSAITVLGTPSEMYVYGTQYWMVVVGYTMMIPFAAHLYLPLFYRLELTSIYEYLELRYSRGVRILVVCLYIFQTIVYLSIVLYTPGLALNALTGINVWICVVAVGSICTFYTSFGGMKATMWADVFQVCTMFAGLFAVIGQGLYDLGMHNIYTRMKDADRLQFFNLDPHPNARHTVWTLSFGACFVWLAIYGTNQAQIQRAMSTTTLREGQRALYYNIPGLFALLTTCCFAGAIVFAQFYDCDPMNTKAHIHMDQLLPLYVLDYLNIPGLPGLFTAAVISGSLSSISGGLNSLSAVTMHDIIRLTCLRDMHEYKAVKLTKLLSIAYGIFMMLLTIPVSNLGGVLQAALGLFGMIGGPTLGLFTLAMFYPWSNTKGAYAGFISGIAIAFWLGIGANICHIPLRGGKPGARTDGCANVTLDLEHVMAVHSNNTTTTELSPTCLEIYGLSYLWYSAMSVFIVNVVGLVVSLFTGPNIPSEVDPALLVPFFDILCCCLPECIRKPLRFDIDHITTTCNEAVESPKGMPPIKFSDYSGGTVSKEDKGPRDGGYTPSVHDTGDVESRDGGHSPIVHDTGDSLSAGGRGDIFRRGKSLTNELAPVV